MTTPDQPNSDNKLHFSHGCAVAISGQSLTREERLDSGLCRTLQICVSGTEVVLIGGDPVKIKGKQVWKYNTDTEEWTKMSVLKESRTNHACAFHKVLVNAICVKTTEQLDQTMQHFEKRNRKIDTYLVLTCLPFDKYKTLKTYDQISKTYFFKKTGNIIVTGGCNQDSCQKAGLNLPNLPWLPTTEVYTVGSALGSHGVPGNLTVARAWHQMVSLSDQVWPNYIAQVLS